MGKIFIMQYVSFPYKEFGNSLSTGLWIPYIYRNNGNEIGVYATYPFPEEWTQQWFDDYKLVDERFYWEIYKKNNQPDNLIMNKNEIGKLIFKIRRTLKEEISHDTI